MSVTDKRRDEDYDEQVEETLQDEVNFFEPRNVQFGWREVKETKQGVVVHRMRTTCTS